jgi:hypothetical protein
MMRWESHHYFVLINAHTTRLVSSSSIIIENMDLIVNFPHSRARVSFASHMENMDLIVNFPQSRARVSFATHTEVITVKNIAIEHKTDLWYTTSELKSFRRDAALLIISIHYSGMTEDQYAELHVSESSAFLGIENYLSKATTIEVAKRRRAIVDAVLLEQERQYRSGDIDAGIMAVTSEAISGLSTRRARLIARLHSK